MKQSNFYEGKFSSSKQYFLSSKQTLLLLNEQWKILNDAAQVMVLELLSSV